MKRGLKMSVDPISIWFYWGGKIVKGSNGSIFYDPPSAKKSTTVRHRITYDELVQKIYEYMKLDKNIVRLKLTLRTPMFVIGSYCLIGAQLIEDDDGVDQIYYLAKKLPLYQAEIYIEEEKIVVGGSENLENDIPSSGPILSMFNHEHRSRLPQSDPVRYPQFKQSVPISYPSFASINNYSARINTSVPISSSGHYADDHVGHHQVQQPHNFEIGSGSQSIPPSSMDAVYRLVQSQGSILDNPCSIADALSDESLRAEDMDDNDDSEAEDGVGYNNDEDTHNLIEIELRKYKRQRNKNDSCSSKGSRGKSRGRGRR